MERLGELKKMGDPVVQRLQEYEGRPKAFDALGSCLVHYQKILDKYDAQVSLR